MMNGLALFKKRIFSEITEIPEFFQQKYLPSLDGLRAFSVGYIIAYHWYLGWEYDVPRPIHLPGFVESVIREGILGVHFFFVLSGFLITTLLIKEKIRSGGISFKNFYLRRVFRILPIATLYVLVTIVLNEIFKLDMHANNFVYPILFSENFNPHHNWFTWHYWSLAVEEQFYLLFPFVMVFRMPVYLRISLILIIVAPCVSFAYAHYKDTGGVWYNVLLYADLYLNLGLLSILIGTFLSVLMFKFSFSIRMNKYLFSAIQVLILLMVLLFHKRVLIGHINDVISDVFIALFLFSILVYKDSIFYKVFNTGIFKWVGILSYSLYIWQEPFTAFQPWKNSFRYGGSILFNLLLLFAVAFLSYNYFEKPFLKLKERFK